MLTSKIYYPDRAISIYVWNNVYKIVLTVKENVSDIIQLDSDLFHVKTIQCSIFGSPHVS